MDHEKIINDNLQVDPRRIGYKLTAGNGVGHTFTLTAKPGDKILSVLHQDATGKEVKNAEFSWAPAESEQWFPVVLMTYGTDSSPMEITVMDLE